MTIKNWEDTDKPREKMMAQGKTALSRRILASVGNSLTALGKQTLAQLTAFKGIGEAKAITILAATEMGRRRAAETPEPQPKIEAPQHVFSLMQPLIGDLPHEEFWVLYLNSANRMIHKCRLSSGGITHTIVDIRLLFKNALEQGAVSLILVHNHPSGSTTPSKEDIELTERVRNAGDTLDIKLLDHVIVTEKEYYSINN